MENKLSIIKDNLKAADRFKTLSNIIAEGQIDELVHLFKDEKISYNVATDIFKMVFNSSLLSIEFLKYCKLLSENNSLEIPSLQDDNTNISTVSYLDNDYSRKAIESFQTHVTLSCESEPDFNSACEAVYSGSSQYAIIPLFNTRDGLIISLYKLIQKYDLKIIASTGVLMNDGNTETEFFLVSRNLSHVPWNKDVRLMLSVTHSYDNTIADLLSATVMQNISLRSINTLPLEYTDERCESVIIFDISACDVSAVDCFFHAALSEASIVGIYSIVK